MNADESRGAVLALIGEIAPDADLVLIDLDADLRTEVDLDSMDFLNLVEGVAETTGVNIPESDYGKVRSVRGLAAYLTERTSV
jgi:acyl carrier protein